jgi:gamma-D-glutamyl-L-lysine dipeptidyl-peptidase
MGEVVRVVRRADGGRWVRVLAPPDRYPGWVRAWGLVPCSAARARRWQALAKARVVVPHAEVVSDRLDGTLVSPVCWSCTLIAGPARGGFRRAELPDGRRGWIAASAVDLDHQPPQVSERIRRLLGVPYLWGGRSTLGIDCSALVQLVCAEQGVALPRDARDQWKATKPLSARGRPEAGDLVFFGARPGQPGHVGLMLGPDYFLHARGMVRINSIEPSDPLCDRDLLPQILGVRSIPGGARMINRNPRARPRRS